MPALHQIIVRPVVTEKSSAAYQTAKVYTFEVHPAANKIAIRQAVEQLFGVKVTGVWTAQQRGKAKRMGRSVGRRNHWKKAIVKLRDGDTIESFGFEG